MNELERVIRVASPNRARLESLGGRHLRHVLDLAIHSSMRCPAQDMGPLSSILVSVIPSLRLVVGGTIVQISGVDDTLYAIMNGMRNNILRHTPRMCTSVVIWLGGVKVGEANNGKRTRKRKVSRQDWGKASKENNSCLVRTIRNTGLSRQAFSHIKLQSAHTHTSPPSRRPSSLPTPSLLKEALINLPYFAPWYAGLLLLLLLCNPVISSSGHACSLAFDLRPTPRHTTTSQPDRPLAIPFAQSCLSSA